MSIRILAAVMLMFAVACIGPTPARAQNKVRIKDITDLEGAQSNHLIGFGLVTGLNGTGSKYNFTQEVAINMLQRFKVTANINDLKSNNISAVMLTAELGPYARVGSRIDVTVSALDSATSLANGELIGAPLKAVDGVEYVFAQGTLSVGGFAFGASGGVGGGGGGAASVQKNHPTVGRISSGIVVREARARVVCNGNLKILVRNADYNTARAIAMAINEKFPGSAFAADAGAVHVFVPERTMRSVDFIDEIGRLEIVPDSVARVVINARTGTIVAGRNVKIDAVAVSHGNLAIVTSNNPIASQPNPFGRGKTVVLPRAQLGVTEQPQNVHVMPPSMTVGEIAQACNALGASPRDLVIIFRELKAANALQAELIVH